MQVLLDTNFMMIPGKFKVDIFKDLEALGRPDMFTIDLVLDELDGISKGHGKDAAAAKLAISFIFTKKIWVVRTKGKVADDELEKLAEKGYVVCTQDRALIKKIKKKKLPVVTLRQRKYLVLG